jgi:hypothetical protein
MRFHDHAVVLLHRGYYRCDYRTIRCARAACIDLITHDELLEVIEILSATPDLGAGSEAHASDLVVKFQRERIGLDRDHPPAEALIRANLGLRRETARKTQKEANSEKRSHAPDLIIPAPRLYRADCHGFFSS